MKDRQKIRDSILRLKTIGRTKSMDESSFWITCELWHENYTMIPAKYFSGVTRTNNHRLEGMQFTTKIVPIKGVDHYLIIRVK